jgi:hypothetical protein
MSDQVDEPTMQRAKFANKIANGDYGVPNLERYNLLG